MCGFHFFVFLMKWFILWLNHELPCLVCVGWQVWSEIATAKEAFVQHISSGKGTHNSAVRCSEIPRKTSSLLACFFPWLRTHPPRKSLSARVLDLVKRTICLHGNAEEKQFVLISSQRAPPLLPKPHSEALVSVSHTFSSQQGCRLSLLWKSSNC